MRWIAWLLFGALACSSGATARDPAGPAPPPSPPADQPPSEPECDALITHAVALGIDERARAPETTTQADHEAIRRQLQQDFTTGCRALPRAAYQCAMAATTLAALAACQPSPSSSTSNSSVAPGGITAPAPRSP